MFAEYVTLRRHLIIACREQGADTKICIWPCYPCPFVTVREKACLGSQSELLVSGRYWRCGPCSGVSSAGLASSGVKADCPDSRWHSQVWPAHWYPCQHSVASDTVTLATGFVTNVKGCHCVLGKQDCKCGRKQLANIGIGLWTNSHDSEVVWNMQREY